MTSPPTPQPTPAQPLAEAQTFAPPSWNALVEAHDRIAPKIHRTPVLTNASLDALTGARIFFKCDNFQKTGSFKIRGATNSIFSLTDEEVSRGIVTQSSGNHGAAIACAAGWRGVKAWVVMPKNVSAIKYRAVESYGAQVTLCEPTVTSRNETCARVQAETGGYLVHPYDDDRIIAGQATAAKELLEDFSDLDAVFAPVSGGGLLSGTCLGAKGSGQIFVCSAASRSAPTMLTAPSPAARCKRRTPAIRLPMACGQRWRRAPSPFCENMWTEFYWPARKKLFPRRAWCGSA